MDVLLAVRKDPGGDCTSTMRPAVGSGSRSLRFDEAACDLKQTPGKHVGRNRTPDPWLVPGRVGLVCAFAKVLKHPRMVEEAGFGLTPAFADIEKVLTGGTRRSVSEGDMPTELSPRREPELWDTLSRLGRAEVPGTISGGPGRYCSGGRGLSRAKRLA